MNAFKVWDMVTVLHYKTHLQSFHADTRTDRRLLRYDTPMKRIQEVVVACQREFTLHDSFTWTPGSVLATDFLHQPLQGQRSCSRWE